MAMLNFGGHIISVGLVAALQNNVDYLLVGRILGAAALGYYTIAFRIPELIIRNLNAVVGNVAHPLLSKLQTDAGKLQSVYFSYVRYISLFTFPAGVGLALTAEPLIKSVYTPKWEPAIFLMQCIAIALAISSVGHVPGVLYKAINRPQILSQLALIKLPVTVGVLWYAAQWNLNAVAVSQIALAIFYMSLDSIVVSRVIGFGLRTFLGALTPALAGAAVMSVTLMIVTHLLSPSGFTGLIFLIVIGISSYIGTLTFVSRETVAKAYTVVMRVAAVRP
jgi:O-antigen/teichoic acid export membrane protein